MVERGTGKVGKLHFDNWPHPMHRRPDRGPNHRVFTDWRVQHASGKFFRKTFRRFKGAAERSADILAINKNAFIITEQLRLRLADRFEVRDAHSRESTRSRVKIAHQSSLSASGAASFCAVEIA